MGMKVTSNSIQYLFDEDTRNAANDVIYGEKKWSEVSPLIAVASEVILEAQNGRSDAYWVLFKGTEEEARYAYQTLEDIGFYIYDYEWHDGSNCLDGPGGRMTVDFYHMLDSD